MGYLLTVAGALIVCSALGLSSWQGAWLIIGLGLFHVGMAD